MVKFTHTLLPWVVVVRHLRPRGHLFLSSLLLSILTLMQEVSPSATSWASRGHRCHPLSPPVRDFHFVTFKVQHSLWSWVTVDFYPLALLYFHHDIFFVNKNMPESPLGLLPVSPVYTVNVTILERPWALFSLCFGLKRCY